MRRRLVSVVSGRAIGRGLSRKHVDVVLAVAGKTDDGPGRVAPQWLARWRCRPAEAAAAHHASSPKLLALSLAMIIRRRRD
jgi:hypothetical protein